VEKFVTDGESQEMTNLRAELEKSRLLVESLQAENQKLENQVAGLLETNHRVHEQGVQLAAKVLEKVECVVEDSIRERVTGANHDAISKDGLEDMVELLGDTEIIVLREMDRLGVLLSNKSKSITNLEKELAAATVNSKEFTLAKDLVSTATHLPDSALRSDPVLSQI
jgi:hypothetical protein